MYPKWTQISLHIYAVWSLFASDDETLYPSQSIEHQALWSDCLDAQIDLNLHWEYIFSCV